MKSKKTILALAIILVLGSVAGYFAYNSFIKSPLSDVDNGDLDIEIEGIDVEAPDFTVYNKDGEEVKLSDFKGKPVVLNFWASWCGPCMGEIPDFDKVYKEKGENVEFLMVNLTDGNNETVETATTAIENGGYSLPIYFDKSEEAAETYEIFAIPTTIFINKDGKLFDRVQGPLVEETLLDYIKKIEK